jgi:DegV family protein with EDD domain
MQKIKFMADTPSDIPDELLKRFDIELLSVPMAVDGREYYERKSFSIREFYDILSAAKEIPVTSRVPTAEFLAAYRRAWESGCTDVICVTINAGGSGTNESAQMARDMFYSEFPAAGEKMKIHIVDSKTYTVAYGLPVVKAAQMARAGKSVADILAYLHDFFDRLEVYLVCYTLEYARKSGRITAAAAVVGDMLGIRPVIAMIDGATKTVEKVRGDKAIPAKLLQIFKKRCEHPEDLICVVDAAVDDYGLAVQSLFQKELNRKIPIHKAGASIVINAGPKIVAICCLGEKRLTKHT